MEAADDETASIFAAGEEMGRLMRSLDWSATPLGPPEGWPQSLKSAVSICLGLRCPVSLFWGADAAVLYNDAWIPLQGEKHPAALGRPAAIVWPESWGEIKSHFDTVSARGRGLWAADAAIPVAKASGRGFRYALSPIRGEGGAVRGLLAAAIEADARAASVLDRIDRDDRDAARRPSIDRLVVMHEEERLRIARALHDRMGQDLAGLSLGLKSLEAAISDESGRETLRQLQSLAAEIGSNVHRTAWELHPTSLDDVGLARALETFAADWSERSGIALDFHVGAGAGDRFAPAIEIAAYRVVEEALSTMVGQAGAQMVSIVLECHGGSLQIILEEDGKGFDPNRVVGIRERLDPLGGTMAVDAEAGRGTTLYIRLPLSPAD